MIRESLPQADYNPVRIGYQTCNLKVFKKLRFGGAFLLSKFLEIDTIEHYIDFEYILPNIQFPWYLSLLGIIWLLQMPRLLEYNIRELYSVWGNGTNAPKIKFFALLVTIFWPIVMIFNLLTYLLIWIFRA